MFDFINNLNLTLPNRMRNKNYALLKLSKYKEKRDYLVRKIFWKCKKCNQLQSKRYWELYKKYNDHIGIFEEQSKSSKEIKKNLDRIQKYWDIRFCPKHKKRRQKIGKMDSRIVHLEEHIDKMN